VLDNILLGNASARFEHVVQAAKKSGCYGFISSLPQGFDSVIENTDAAQFSGGQLQRICLARVFLSTAPLVLFDEPTTGLDDASIDLFVQAAVELKREGRGVLFASHEKRIVSLADQVISI
jgi:ABC-type multidrug transport system fused ATPase/permease subunit